MGKEKEKNKLAQINYKGQTMGIWKSYETAAFS